MEFNSRNDTHKFVPFGREARNAASKEPPDVRSVVGHVELGSRVEVERVEPFDGRRDALDVAAQAPPLAVVVVGRDVAVENAPAPLVDEVAERQKRDLTQSHVHQEVQVQFCQENKEKGRGHVQNRRRVLLLTVMMSIFWCVLHNLCGAFWLSLHFHTPNAVCNIRI